jgi:phosphoribosylglycinamide formyltransferase-1
MKLKLRLGLFISGGGTTMQRIIQACQSGELKSVCPAVVIASKEKIGGIAKAQALDVPIEVIQRGFFGCEASYADVLLRECKKYAVDLIGQYGWLPKTPQNLIEAYSGRMINQHPGPLDPGRPDFGGKGMYGRRVHAARLFFVRSVNRDFWTEATAQRVAVEFDKGAVLRRRVVPIFPDDDPITLQERVLPEEHAVQIETLRDFADNRVRETVRSEPLVDDLDVLVLDEAKRVAGLLFPHG